MKLYYSKGACSLVPRIIINELGLTCEYESVDLRTKKTETGKDFLTINSKGAVPVLALTDADVLTENAVILQYLADTNQAENLLPSIGHIQRYHVLAWLNYITTELHKSFGPLFNANLPQDLKQSIFIPLLKKKFEYVNEQLGTREFIYGDHFTLPDAYLFVMLTWCRHFRLELTAWPNLNRYFTQLLTREAVQKSLQQEGLQIPAMA